jgi:hypothetical protein
MPNLPANLEERVRVVAYNLWLQEGQPNGRAEEHWFRANELVNAEAHEAATTARPKRVIAKKSAPRKRT